MGTDNEQSMSWKQYILCPIVLVSIQIFLILLFIVNQNFRPSSEPLTNLHAHSNIILLGHFNYPSFNLSTWKESWSRVVNPDDIIIAVPNAQNKTPHFILQDTQQILYKNDRGYVSPYANIAKVIREREDINGILYVHDDMLLSSSVLRKIGGTEWLATNVNAKKFAIYKNSTSESIKDAPTWWVHWKGCIATFLKMFNDSRLKPFKHKSVHQDSFINMKQGQSDMLYAYLPREQKLAFLNLLELFSEYKLFLECAIPTSVLLMQEKFDIALKSIPLCTFWNGLRGKPKEMIKKCGKDIVIHGAYHPIKISFDHDWVQHFDDISST